MNSVSAWMPAHDEVIINVLPAKESYVALHIMLSYFRLQLMTYKT